MNEEISMSESDTTTREGSLDPKHALRRSMLGRPRGDLLPAKALVERYRPSDISVETRP